MIAQIQRDISGSPVRIRLLEADGASRSELVVDQCDVMVYSREKDEHLVSLEALRRAYRVTMDLGNVVERFIDLGKFLDR